MQPVVKGLLAGAAGTVALNLATYTDMLLRARPSSEVPTQVADRLAERTGVQLGDADEKSNREQAVGSVLGYVTGLGVGAAYGLLERRSGTLPLWATGPLLGAAAMAGSDVPATVLGVTDPTSWEPASWASDAVPHLLYGLTTASVYRALD
jgi:xanthosine utilization system XapX-like protein